MISIMSQAGIDNDLAISATSLIVGNTKILLGLGIQIIHRSRYIAGIVGISHSLGKVDTILHFERTRVGHKHIIH